MARKSPADWINGVKRRVAALFRPSDKNVARPNGQELATRSDTTKTQKTRSVTRHVPRVRAEELETGQQQTMLGMLAPRRRPHNMLLAIVFTTAKLVLILLMVIAAGGLGALVGVAQAYVETTPTLDVGRFTDLSQTSFIYDKNGTLITTFVGIEDREWVDIEEIPDMLQNAFIAVEDVRFLKHQGVDYKRLFSAVIGTLTNNNAHGGSTITQQLIKNSILTNEVSYKRKIQEAYLALELEKQYDKSEILEAYLNIIHLGESNYGVKAAAKDYFSKELQDLTVRECAMIAGLTQNPYSYNPRKNMYQRDTFSVTDERTDVVLRRMYNASLITRQQYEKAMSERGKVHIVEVSQIKQMYDMPYFVEYGIQDVITHMIAKEGLQDSKQNRTAMENKLRTGGYRIYLTVDPEVQNAVQDTLATWKDYPQMRDPAYSNKVAKNPDGTIIDVPQPQAAAAILDYHTGELRAIVGGRTPPERKKQLNRAYQASMPIGSSTKPISVYGPALDAGASPATIFANVPVPIEGYGGTRGYPNNFGGNMDKTMGLVTMRTGVKSSLNVVAARALLEWGSVEGSRDYLINLGVDPSHVRATPAGLALGTSGITPIEMAAAYGAIANGGVYQKPLSFIRVLDSKGNVVLDAAEIRAQSRRQVFKPSTCWMLVSMMTDAVKGGTGTRAQIKGMTVAGKTGTNDDYRGVFFSGMTPYYSAAVWVGHDDYNPQLRRGATGGTYAAPLWQAFMAKVHDGLPDKDIIEDTPESLGLVKATVCSISGKLAIADCSLDAGGNKPVSDWFLSGTEPAEYCDMHVSQHICSVSGRMTTPYCPESLVEAKSILVIPPSSPLALLPQETLLKILPHAYLNLPDQMTLQSMMPGTAEYEQYYCPVHTETWYYSSGGNVVEQASEAAQVIAKVNEFMNNPNTVLSEAQRMTLLNIITDLQDWMQRGHPESIASRVAALERVYNEMLAQQRGYTALP